MLQTGTWYKEQLERRLRVTVDSRFDAVDVLNRAGLMLLQAHQWGPSLNDEWTLRAKKGETFIPLPREVVKINGTIKTTSSDERVELIGLAELRRRAQRNDLATSSSNTLWLVALDGRRASTPAEAAQRGFSIEPPPVVDDSPTLIVSGTRGWRDFTLTTLDQRPSLCDHWHNAYFLACCCVAQETRAPEDGPAPERPLYQAAVDALWDHEEDAVPDMGILRGAVQETEEHDPFPADWNNSAQNP